MNCVLPGCRSNYSLLWGTATPEELVTKAASLGMRHLGLADNDNLYAAIDFYRACRETGINPLLGVRLTTDLGPLHLIAKDYNGYQNLCRLVTEYALDKSVTPEHLNQYFNNVLCLAPTKSVGRVLKDIFNGQPADK